MAGSLAPVMFFILPSKLTENTFSFTAMTWGIVKGMNELIVSWG
jgi:hypothetical protein